MQTLTKLKLTTSLKLTCTQITQGLKKVGWKENDSCSKVKRMKHKIKMKSKVFFKQVSPHSLTLVNSKMK
jgi:hypothetical protein